MKALVALVMALLATTLLSGCGDGPCAAGFSFKYCLNQTGSSSSATTKLTIGGTVNGLGTGKTLRLIKNLNPTITMNNTEAGISVNSASSGFLVSDNNGTEYTAGWSFTLASSRLMTHLGVWSDGSLYGDVDLGLWDSSGKLLSSISLLIANLATYGIEGYFSYAALPTSIMLDSGTYTVGGFYKGGVLAGYGAPVTPINGLTYATPSLVDFGAALAQPILDASNASPNGFFGPNLRFLTGAASSTGEQITLSNNSSFTFPTALFAGDIYVVEVFEQPEGQVCSVLNGIGTMVNAAVTNVLLHCSTVQ